MNKDVVHIGLIGFGTIGSGVVETFNKNLDLLENKVNKKINLKKVVDLILKLIEVCIYPLKYFQQI